MNPSYVQTFARHRVLFSLPLVVTTLIAIWFVLGTPKAYQATTSLWVDTPPPGVSSLDRTNLALPSPAAQAQQLLSELLTTNQFRLTIGRQGPLARYLAGNPSTGWGPKALLARLRGSATLDERVEAALDANHVVATVDGPQVLGLTLRGPTPAVAVGTLKGLVTAFNNERRNLDVKRQQIAMGHFQNQVNTATATLSAVQTKLANPSGASPEVLRALTQARRAARSRLTNATRAYNQASLSLAAAQTEKPTFQVIDPPKLPAPAVSGLKKSAFTLIAGLFAGGLVSFLGIALFSGREKSVSEQAELRDAVMRSEHETVPEDTVGGVNGSPSDRASTPKAESGAG